MHQTTVAKLEAGKRPLRVAELLALSQIFGLPAAAFLYIPITGQSPSLERMQQRLEEIDVAIQQARETSASSLETYAQVYAERSAERLALVDSMRLATEFAAISERAGGGGEGSNG